LSEYNDSARQVGGLIERFFRFVRQAQYIFQACTVAGALPHRYEITVQALLMTLVRARASDMKRSMVTSSATPATGRSGMTASVAMSATSPLPDTPAAPFDVSKHHREHRRDLCAREMHVARLSDEHRGERQVDRRAASPIPSRTCT
jgi:hypothetical protein